MDVDELFEDAKPAARPSKFAPKGSRKPNQKPINSSKREDDPKIVLVPKTEPGASASAPMDVDANSNPPKDELQDTPKDEPMEMAEKEEEEDAVVREIDVYFNPSTDPNTKLYVMQYPLRPMWRPYEQLEERCSEVRVKRESADIEVDLTVDPNSANIDPDSAFKMTKQTLKTTWKAPIHAGYAVGVLVGNRLHLNPLHAVVQLRPSIQHTESELRTNTVDEGRKKQSKSPGSVNDRNEDAGENWVPLKYHGPQSYVSGTHVRKMVEQNESPLNFSMSRHDYLNSCCPGTSHGNNRSKGSLRRDLSSLPLEERIKTALLEEPQIHRFVALKYLAPDTPDEDIFDILIKYANLVQGLWVPNSRQLYNAEGSVEVLARDYVLLLFSESPYIKDEQLPKAMKINKAIKDVLSVLAIERQSIGDWKFKEPPDENFIKCNPMNIVGDQKEKWEKKKEGIITAAAKGNNRPATDRSATSKSLIKPSLPSSTGQKKQMPEETCDALLKALKKLFQIHKVCSFNQICRGLRELAVAENSRPKGSKEFLTAASAVTDHSTEELRSVISQFAVEVHGVYIPKSSPEHPQYDDGFRQVVIDLFRGSNPNAKLKKDYMIEAARDKLKRDVSSTEYQKVVQELCVSQNSAWVLKSGDGKPK